MPGVRLDFQNISAELSGDTFGMTYLTILALAGALLYACTASPTMMSYEQYLSLVQQRQQEHELQRDKRAQRSHCSLFPFNRTVYNDDGCVGHLPLFGCAGRCRSTEIPHYYTSRQAANLPNPMISTCKCCSHTELLPVPVLSPEIELQCGNSTNETVTVVYTVLLPIDCGCTSCV